MLSLLDLLIRPPVEPVRHLPSVLLILQFIDQNADLFKDNKVNTRHANPMCFIHPLCLFYSFFYFLPFLYINSKCLFFLEILKMNGKKRHTECIYVYTLYLFLNVRFQNSCTKSQKSKKRQKCQKSTILPKLI